MPSVTIGSAKLPNGFPPGTSFRLEWVADQKRSRRNDAILKPGNKYKERRLVWNSKDIEFEVTRFLDPGKYIWKAHKSTDDGHDNFRESGEILVGMTEAQWVRISHLKPRMQHPTMTSDGIVFRCIMPGCDTRTRSKVSALLHESDAHYGVDLLKSEDPIKDKQSVDHEIDSQSAVRRGPGRPPKSSYGVGANAD